MPAPLAKGLIIAASVLVAAGIALYESPQVRQWVDQSRRKIAVALHSLGDDIHPARRASESSQDYESRRKRREELIRRNRNELVRRAREEGIAVDLDELARIGTEDIQMAERRTRADRSKSFDDMVGSDGMLREVRATGKDTAEGSSLRKRGAPGFTVDSASVLARSNPFSDEQVIIDLDGDEAHSPKPFTYVEPGTRESSATLEGNPVSPPAPELLIDLDSNSVHLQPSSQGLGSLTHLETSDTDQAAQSFYSFTSSESQARDPATAHHFFDDTEAEHISTGTLTPRSERSMATGASVVDSQADDIAILSMQNSVHNESDHDARSEIFSEGGFTDAGFSEAGFSDVGTADRPDRLGIMTPSSWTDVGSDDESEWGGVAGTAHVSQMHQ